MKTNTEPDATLWIGGTVPPDGTTVIIHHDLNGNLYYEEVKK